MSNSFIYPDWPAAKSIHAFSTIRCGGVSAPPYDSLNLGDHVGDTPKNVLENRDILFNSAHLPETPRWLTQVHGTTISQASSWKSGDKADAIISDKTDQVCAMMTADCLPILLCSQQGDKVAAIHAGWRGLANGIIEKTLHNFGCSPENIMVWFGPAIGPEKFEVGVDVYQCFTEQSPLAALAFKQTDASHYLANIYLLATQRLNACGVHSIFGGDHCTASDSSRFFSYRRDSITGRMASLIWISPK